MHWVTSQMKSLSHIKKTELYTVVRKSVYAKRLTVSNTNCSLYPLFFFNSIILSKYWNLMVPI